MRPRSAPVIADHVAKPEAAEATARSTSAAPALWTRQISRPVAGLMVAKSAPLVASVRRPSMKRACTGSMV